MAGKIYRSYLAFEMKIMMVVHFYGKYQQEKKRQFMKKMYTSLNELSFFLYLCVYL